MASLVCNIKMDISLIYTKVWSLFNHFGWILFSGTCSLSWCFYMTSSGIVMTLMCAALAFHAPKRKQIVTGYALWTVNIICIEINFWRFYKIASSVLSKRKIFLYCVKNCLRVATFALLRKTWNMFQSRRKYS